MPSRALRKVSGGNAPTMIRSFSKTKAGMARIPNRRASVMAVSRRSWQRPSLNAGLSFSGSSPESDAISRITSGRPISLRSVKKARKTFSWNSSKQPASRANSPCQNRQTGIRCPLAIVKHHTVALATLSEIFKHGGYFVRPEFVRQKSALGRSFRLQLVGQPFILDVEFISKLIDKTLADPAKWSYVVRKNTNFHLKPRLLIVLNKLFK